MLAPILTRVSEPAPLLTLFEAKSHLRIDHNDEDDYVQALVASVTATLDGPQGMYGYPIASQRWGLTCSGPDSLGVVILPLTPASSLVSVSYFPAGGGAAVVADDVNKLAAWTLRGAETWAHVVPASGTWPALANRFDALTVVWTAGYATPFADIKQAAKLLLGHYYANREAVAASPANEVPLALESLVNLRRRWWLP